jgi:hypothetical protein
MNFTSTLIEKELCELNLIKILNYSATIRIASLIIWFPSTAGIMNINPISAKYCVIKGCYPYRINGSPMQGGK